MLVLTYFIIKSFCLSLDERNKAGDTAHLITNFQSITYSFEMVEELSSLKSFPGPMTGEDLFLSACETPKGIELPWLKVGGGGVCVTTSVTYSMIRKETSLMDRFRREMDKHTQFYMERHCIIHQQSLCGVVMSVVNFTRFYGFNHR
jgi:hypothetical protein